MAKVWTYWRCESCGSIIRGDCRSCPNCSEPIPNGVKYLMPNNPIVRKAIADGTIKTNANIHVDEKGIVAEVVAKEEERTEANWNCPFCGYQNFATDIVCKGCGAGKESSTTDYFGNKTKMSEQNKSDYKKRMGWDYEEPAQKEEPVSHLRKAKETESTSKTSKISKKLYDIFIGNRLYRLIFVIIPLLFFIWLSIPVTRTSTVTDISWERSISISKWQKFNEDDWSLPPNATLIKTR